MKGILITMEGPDGSGKSTQIELLREEFERLDKEVLITREPGGNAISEAIRGIILNREYENMASETEMLLYAAARAQLVYEVIKPALLEGKVVICDRFVDSSAVYQGIGRGLGVDAVYEVNKHALSGITPDLTILLDLSAEEGIRRKKNQAELDRMEALDISFHRMVSEGYRELAKSDPQRILSVDATLSVEEIHKKVMERVTALLKRG
ncbi:MAG: dTMP kinase [Lachnospiraceae bacterium]|nr:dTMP kinase [Lachnospiraceae bacterium]